MPSLTYRTASKVVELNSIEGQKCIHLKVNNKTIAHFDLVDIFDFLQQAFSNVVWSEENTTGFQRRSDIMMERSKNAS